MGLRNKLKQKLKGVVENFSGEYSSAAPDEITPYGRTGIPTDGSKVTRARLNRPKNQTEDASDD